MIINIILVMAAVLAALMVLLFVIYFFNLDMKLIVNVVAPVLEKHYDKTEKNQKV